MGESRTGLVRANPARWDEDQDLVCQGKILAVLSIKAQMNQIGYLEVARMTCSRSGGMVGYDPQQNKGQWRSSTTAPEEHPQPD